MEPLAYRMRPTTFETIYGQDHLVGSEGVLTKMIQKNKPFSFILYGPPGTGKTSIAYIFAKMLSMDAYFFNAATDAKQKLKDIIETIHYHNIVLIIDEIHRMKSDIQDYLLPVLENGKVIVVGMTTLNPYMSVNPAIRSRLHLYEVKSLSDDDIIAILQLGIRNLDVDIQATTDALTYIAHLSNHEVRQALNILESTSLILNDQDTLTLHIVQRVMGKKQQSLDASGDHYYQLLSALQKSIRGSDVDASIHYLARLITLGDLDSILRRLMVICYEDIGLANPTMGQKMLTAYEISKKIGLPEARIVLSNIVIDMAISPKSNSAYLAIDKALYDFENTDTGTLPDHVNNAKIKLDSTIYHYPHNDKDSLNDQSYLPIKIFDAVYYRPKIESYYERALKERLDKIDLIKHKKR